MATSIEKEMPVNAMSDQTLKSPASSESGTIARRHDLDSLRAVAMLLGIVLHAALSFAPIPWSVQDTQQNESYYVLFAAIHGFRMPLFFLVSGFFTAMLWRKRGLGGLVIQRLMRIVLPLFIGCLTIIPAMWVVTIIASQPSGDAETVKYFDAAAAGDSETVINAIDSGAVAIDSLHPTTGASLLTVATFYGQTETVERLLEKGADVNQRNGDSGTPLHVAMFLGNVESAKRLLDAGADADAKDGNGNTPKDNLKVDFGTTSAIAQMYGMSIDRAELEKGRSEIAALLGQEIQSAKSDEAGSVLSALYGLFFHFPAFMHLWFLAFLCWLLMAFAAYSVLARAIDFKKFPKWLFCSPVSLIWLVPLTMLPQYFMAPESFGPDASIGFLPIPSVLAYYAIFFFFGAIYWELDDRSGMLGHWWYVTLPFALFIIFPISLDVVSGTFGVITMNSDGWLKPLLGNFLQSLFAWLMIFGSIGMFRALFSGENKTMRYISDSSYWLYLAHLPLVIFAQWLVRDLPVPAVIKFFGIVVVTSGILLVTYEYCIRYTFIGSVLNGPKKRGPKDQAVEKSILNAESA